MHNDNDEVSLFKSWQQQQQQQTYTLWCIWWCILTWKQLYYSLMHSINKLSIDGDFICGWMLIYSFVITLDFKF